MWSRIFAAASFSLLAACTPQVVVKTVCPPIVEYEPDWQKAASDEVDALPSDSKVVRLVLDYRQLRAIIRSCQ